MDAFTRAHDLSKDPMPMNVYSCGFMIDGHQLGFLGELEIHEVSFPGLPDSMSHLE